MKWIRDRLGHDYTVNLTDDEDWEDAEVHEGHEVGMIYRDTLTTYSLRVLVPPVPYEERPHVYSATEQDKRVMADLPAMLELVEEQLEGLLPEGYQVRITEWNK